MKEAVNAWDSETDKVDQAQSCQKPIMNDCTAQKKKDDVTNKLNNCI